MGRCGDQWAFLASRVLAQVPDTPAGRQFTAWLDAMNSSDPAAMQQFMDKSMPGSPVEQGLAVRNNSGGYDLKKVETTSATNIVVLVQERGPGKQFGRLTINVTAEAPDRIAGIFLQPAQPPPELAPSKLTAAEAEAARTGAPFRQLSVGKHRRPNELSCAKRRLRVSSAGASDGRAEFPVPRIREAELIAALRAKVEKDEAAERFAGAVLVGRIANGNGTVLFSEAYGLSDREARVANTLDTRFRMGSMNKMFTAVSILQLV